MLFKIEFAKHLNWFLLAEGDAGWALQRMFMCMCVHTRAQGSGVWVLVRYTGSPSPASIMHRKEVK